MLCSTLSGKLAIKHPRLGILVREDGAVFNRVGKSSKYAWTFGSLHKSSGYCRIVIEQRQYRVHRLVLEAFVGNCPDGMTVDHINRNRSDNRLCNLRYATLIEQQTNTIKVDKCLSKYGVRPSRDPKAWKKAYDNTNAQHIKEYSKQVWQTKKDSEYDRWKKYYATHKDEINEKRRLRHKRNRMKGHSDVEASITDPRTPG